MRRQNAGNDCNRNAVLSKGAKTFSGEVLAHDYFTSLLRSTLTAFNGSKEPASHKAGKPTSAAHPFPRQ